MILPNIEKAFVVGAVQIKIKPNGSEMGELRLIKSLPVLEKNDDWDTHSVKLLEEAREVFSAIQLLDYIENPINTSRIPKTKEEAAASVVAETLDVMQMCIGVLDKALDSYPVLKDAELQHIEKLYSRGWKFKKWLRIEED